MGLEIEKGGYFLNCCLSIDTCVCGFTALDLAACFSVRDSFTLIAVRVGHRAMQLPLRTWFGMGTTGWPEEE